MMEDIRGGRVQIEINGKTLWVNIEGVCRLRVVDVQSIDFEALNCKAIDTSDHSQRSNFSLTISALLLLFALLFASVSQAQQVEVNASLIILCPARAYCDDLTEVRTLAQRIGYKNWTIIVEPPQLFTRDAHKNHAYHNTAFSILGANITYINSDAIRGNNLAWILTHERGHYICNCADEHKAQSAADSLKSKVGLA